MNKQDTREVQEALRTLSYDDPRLLPLAVDGIYGAQTAEAVRIFQTLYGYAPTGEVDRETWEALRDLTFDRYIANPTTLNVFAHPDYVLEPDDTTVTAGVIQLMLRELSQYYGNIQPVELSGTYDPATVQQIRRLQKLHRLEADGRVDLPTWNMLSVLFNNRTDSTRG